MNYTPENQIVLQDYDIADVKGKKYFIFFYYKNWLFENDENEIGVTQDDLISFVSENDYLGEEFLTFNDWLENSDDAEIKNVFEDYLNKLLELS